MKLLPLLDAINAVESLPPRGAWIETVYPGITVIGESGRSPHGERGLKPISVGMMITAEPVAPPTGSVD